VDLISRHAMRSVLIIADGPHLLQPPAPQPQLQP
jgi:hypothetical protein